MQPINSPTAPNYSAVLETAPLRRAKLELAQLQEILDLHPSWNDAMTLALKKCVKKFEKYLKNHPEHAEYILEQQHKTLQELLIDPNFQEPLDEECLLGSDGNTYGRKSLQIFLTLLEYSRAPEQTHSQNQKDDQSSKNAQQTKELFKSLTVQDHLVVKAFVSWLKQNQLLLSSSLIETHYENFQSKGLLVSIPYFKVPRQLIEKYESLFLLDNPSQEDWQDESILEESERLLAEQKKAMQEIQAEQADFAEQLQESGKRQLQEIEELGLSFQNDAEIFAKALEALDQDIAALEKSVKDNENQLSYLNTCIDQTAKSLIQLKKAYNQAERERKKRNRGWLKTLVGTLGSIGLCYAATIVLGPAGGSVAPKPGGNFSFTFRF